VSVKGLLCTGRWLYKLPTWLVTVSTLTSLSGDFIYISSYARREKLSSVAWSPKFVSSFFCKVTLYVHYSTVIVEAMPSSNPLTKLQKVPPRKVINPKVYKNRLSTFCYWSLKFLANNFLVNFLDRFQQMWIHSKILCFLYPILIFWRKIFCPFRPSSGLWC
jgi:hypothetical protein